MSSSENGGAASLRVIGAGPGRTGTASLKAALDILGFGPCYHMSENVANGDQLEWVKVLREKKPSPEKLAEILSGYGSSLDFPSCVTYTELMEAFPEAKVILTTRNARSWARSAKETIFSPRNQARSWFIMPWKPFHHLQGRLYRSRFFYKRMPRRVNNGTLRSETALVRAIQSWNQNVISSVPKEKLLVFDVQEGWEPLCKFLGVDVPAQPFPHINDTEEFKAEMMDTWRKHVLLDCAVVAGAVVVWKVVGGLLSLLKPKKSSPQMITSSED